jgi:hypothetical protein
MNWITIIVRFEDFSAVYVQIMFFGVVLPFSPVGEYNRFREAQSLDLSDSFLWKLPAEIIRSFRLLLTSTLMLTSALASTDKTT